MILEKTVELVTQIYRYHKIIPPRVSKIVIGLGYTGVELEALAYGPFLGLAYTIPGIIQNTDCSKIEFAGDLKNKKIFGELLQWSYGSVNLKKIIGIATLNAVSQHILEIINPYQEIKGDLIDFTKICNSSRVTFIGNIAPLVRQVSLLTKEITIVEENQKKINIGNNFKIKRSIDELDEKELNSDVLFCTGTTLINNSIEEILHIFKKTANYIILIGPTASMIPDVLFDNGVDIVGGMKIFDTKATLRIIQEGGGTKLFKNYGKKYNFIKQ
ncbi:MAG: DUF364 domain-containing protein [Candidatus Lokiarchaeota archaeon]|nr:DUF364 domain-containing protein [Candidatus Lokiarchaeota archaeon]